MRALLLAAALLPLTSHLSGAQSQELSKEELSPGIFLFRAPSTLDLWTATNVVVVVNENDVTVFDSFTRAGTARLVIAEIRKVTDKPVKTLINSHWHQDHWSGNNEFQKAWPGIQIIATRGTRDYMKRMPGGFFAGSLARSVTSSRAVLDTAIRTGKTADGKPLTAEARAAQEKDIAETASFEAEVRSLPRVLPNVAFQDTLVFWSGSREFRLLSATGDATTTAVLYLPAEKILVTGDVLVAPESGDGPPPWTTNSFSITPWLESLRSLERLEVTTIVPGQGKAFRGKDYLQLTIETFNAIISQVHAALERGVVGVDPVLASVDVDAQGRKYGPNGNLSPNFKPWVAALSRKVYQESLDGISR
ncbi:MAG TPA: MBL fold metallo-hydrolase [Gemmatimonadales bacterium]|nr:MBL fold metallo-hydrolase [Gemmatimonadales bacterium]